MDDILMHLNDIDYINKRIEEDPRVLLRLPLPELPNEVKRIYITTAVRNNIQVTFSDYFENRYLLDELPLKVIEQSLKREPRVLVLLNDEMYDMYISEYRRDFVPTIEDLKLKPIIRKDKILMNNAVEENPEAILYTEVNLNQYIVDDAFSQLDLTREDFISHPFLCHLVSSPDSRYYEYYVDQDYISMAQVILEYIKKGDFDSIRSIPFLSPEINPNLPEDFDINTVLSVIKLINPVLDDDKQPEYWDTFSCMIDGICFNRYSTEKRNFQFPSIDSLIEYIERNYRDNEEEFLNGNTEPLLKIVVDILNFEGKKDERTIGELHEIFILMSEDSPKLKEKMTLFANRVLNEHMNQFVNRERERILLGLTESLDLLPKREEEIIRGKRIKVAREYIRQRFGETKQLPIEYLESFNKVIETLKSNYKRIGIICDDNKIDEVSEQLLDIFLEHGGISKNEIRTILEESSPGYVIDAKTVESISRKFDSIVMKVASTLKLTSEHITHEDRIKYERDGFTPKTFRITSRGKTDQLLALVIGSIATNERLYKRLIKQKDKGLTELQEFIPYFMLSPGVLPELDLNLFINMLTNYERIKQLTRRKVVERHKKRNEDYAVKDGTNLVKYSFGDFMTIANAFGASDNLTNSIIVSQVRRKIGEHELGKYASFYMNYMFPRYQSSIPVIKGETSNYFFESDYKDQERLLIGRMYPNSCIDLEYGTGGEETFKECLGGPNGDVLLLRDKNTRELKGRILVVRRGNTLVLNLRNYTHEYDDDIEEIMHVVGQTYLDSKNPDDELEFVVATPMPETDENKDRIITSAMLRDHLPHADWANTGEIVAQTRAYSNENDFRVGEAHTSTYFKPRAKILTEEEATDDDLTFLKAMSILKKRKEMEPYRSSSSIDHSEEQDFEPVLVANFRKLFVGEDFYIGIKENGEVEEVIVETADMFRQREELETVREKVKEARQSL